MEELQQISELIKTVGSGGMIAMFFFLWKAGLIRLNGKSNQTEIKNELSTIRENHLHELKEGIEDIKNSNIEIKQSLQEIIRYGVKIRKNGNE